MKPTQQQKDNKLIAKFMGLTIITDNISYFDTNYKPLKKYNEDWNWLMEVVEKIENLEDGEFSVEITNNCCEINGFEIHTNLFICNNSETKIQAVYNACVDFIKWYNEQNK
jgi:hypothetical protein